MRGPDLEQESAAQTLTFLHYVFSNVFSVIVDNSADDNKKKVCDQV